MLEFSLSTLRSLSPVGKINTVFQLILEFSYRRKQFFLHVSLWSKLNLSESEFRMT